MADKWVLDCSAIAAVVLAENEGAEVSEILEQALEDRIQILVPALFWYEISNVLATAVRNNRITSDQAQESLVCLKDLPFDADMPGDFIVHRRIFDLVILHNLSAYDAAYLELAERLKASLKTFDKAVLKLHRRYSWIH